MATAWALVRRGSAQAMMASRHVAKAPPCCLGLMLGALTGMLSHGSWCQYRDADSLSSKVCQCSAGHGASADNTMRLM